MLILKWCRVIQFEEECVHDHCAVGGFGDGPKHHED